MQDFFNFIQLITNILTAIASGIAIYIFIFKRKVIASIFKILLNYSSQITLSELKIKLDRINDLDVSNTDHYGKVMNLLNEIVGQIRGNQKLKRQCSNMLEKLEVFTDNPKNKLTEPKKRNLISELKETIRHIDLENIDELVGGKNE
jgi:hypothetical protein